ncbi:MAG TPA: phosphotransferase [Lacipirellulaceae bacterium]|jgi:homoserine kinase type II
MNHVRQVLDRYPADCQPLRVEPLGSAGGMSGAQFWRMEAPRGRLVLRRWPSEHPTPDGLRFIHSVLRHVYEEGLHIVPAPIAMADGATFIEYDDHLWELAPRLPGEADYERSPRIEKLRAAMVALAQFHLATADYKTASSALGSAGGSPAITRRLARIHELQSGGIDVLARSISNEVWPELARLARQFLAALPAAIPRAIAELAPLVGVALPLQSVIRDIWHDHILFEGDTVTGLIDFGALEIDTPAGDVARLLGSLVGDDEVGWREGLVAYASVRRLSEPELAAVAAFDTSGTLLAGCNWIRWIYVDHRQFENRGQVLERFRRIVTRLQNQLP